VALGPVEAYKLAHDDFWAVVDRCGPQLTQAVESYGRFVGRRKAVQLSPVNKEHHLPVIPAADAPQDGCLTEKELMALGAGDPAFPFNGARCQVVQSWLLRWILQRRTNGGVKTDAPVFAAGNFRTFQCGNESFHKCLAIVETPFPYPYAQGTMVMLLLWCLCSPFMVCEIVNNDAYAIFTAGVTSMAFALLNEVRPSVHGPARKSKGSG